MRLPAQQVLQQKPGAGAFQTDVPVDDADIFGPCWCGKALEQGRGEEWHRPLKIYPVCQKSAQLQKSRTSDRWGAEQEADSRRCITAKSEQESAADRRARSTDARDQCKRLRNADQPWISCQSPHRRVC